MPEELAKVAIRQVVKALDRLHSLDIVHRDLKLENVLVNREVKAKLIDFGFSRQLSRENEVLSDFCGTPHYMAPEVIQREGYYGKPADIWSLGVIIYRITVGCFPFKGINEKTIFSKVMKGELTLPAHLSGPLTDLLTRMLTLDYRRRPSIYEVLTHYWLE